MTKYWVDPSEGWKYGFPKVYDDEKDGNILEFLEKHGYPNISDETLTRWWAYEEE